VVNTKAHLAQTRWIRGRYHDSCAIIFRVRECYHHSYAISKLRAGVSAGLGGFVAFRQLPRRPDECDRLAKIDRASGNERPTALTAGNRRSRRPSFWLAHEARAPLARDWERGAEGVPHARASQDEAVGGRVAHTFIKRSPVGAGDDGVDMSQG